MDFIKKHFEKITLALGLLVLIGFAIVLSYKVSSLSSEIQEAPHRPKPKGKTVQPVPMADYTNAMAALEHPAQWGEHSIDPFDTKARVVIVENRLPIPDHTLKGPVEPVILLGIRRELFKMIFTSYTGDGENFQLNFISRSRSFFVPRVGMAVEGLESGTNVFKTGYVITKFERKTNLVDVAGVGNRPVDASELTLEHPGEEPIVLVLNKNTEKREPVAIVQCAETGKQLHLRLAQTFDCGTNTYNVVDIGQKQMIIVDVISKEKHTISLGVPNSPELREGFPRPY